MRYNRFLPLLVPLFSWLLLELFYFWPNLIYVSLVLIILLLFFASRQFVLASYKEEKWWNLAILPSCFTIGLVAFATMMSLSALVQFLFLLNTVFLYIYFRAVYYYLVKTDSYEQYHLANIAAYSNFLAFFFIASSIYGLQAFLNFPAWAMMIILLLFIVLIVYQVMWANLINIKVALFYILVFSIVLVEVAWSASFLTLSYYVLGLLLSICYYVTIGLLRSHLLGKLDVKTARFYLIFGLLSIVLVLLTARWL